MFVAFNRISHGKLSVKIYYHPKTFSVLPVQLAELFEKVIISLLELLFAGYSFSKGIFYTMSSPLGIKD